MRIFIFGKSLELANTFFFKFWVSIQIEKHHVTIAVFRFPTFRTEKHSSYQKYTAINVWMFHMCSTHCERF